MDDIEALRLKEQEKDLKLSKELKEGKEKEFKFELAEHSLYLIIRSYNQGKFNIEKILPYELSEAAYFILDLLINLDIITKEELNEKGDEEGDIRLKEKLEKKLQEEIYNDLGTIKKVIKENEDIILQFWWNKAEEEVSAQTDVALAADKMDKERIYKMKGAMNMFAASKAVEASKAEKKTGKPPSFYEEYEKKLNNVAIYLKKAYDNGLKLNDEDIKRKIKHLKIFATTSPSIGGGKRYRRKSRKSKKSRKKSKKKRKHYKKKHTKKRR